MQIKNTKLRDRGTHTGRWVPSPNCVAKCDVNWNKRQTTKRDSDLSCSKLILQQLHLREEKLSIHLSRYSYHQALHPFSEGATDSYAEQFWDVVLLCSTFPGFDMSHLNKSKRWLLTIEVQNDDDYQRQRLFCQ